MYLNFAGSGMYMYIPVNNKIDIEKNLMNNSFKLSNLNLYMYIKCLKSNLKSTYGTYPVVELWSPE